MDDSDIGGDQLAAIEPRWSSNSFRSLLLNAIDVVVIIGPDSAIQYASAGVEREFGYRTQDLIGGNVVDLIHPDDQERLAGLFAQLRAVPGSDCATELRSRHFDGTWRWLEVGCTNLAEDPAVGGIVVVARDATARVKAEEALRASEVRFRSAFDSAVDVVTITDAGGKIQYQTPSVERVLGYGSRDLFGTVLGDLVHPDQRADWEARLHRIAVEPGATDTSEWDMRHRDGEWRTVEVVWNNLLLDPSVRGVVVIARDITEHKRTEERLRAQASLLDLAHDAILVIDPGSGEITFWNRGAEELYGFSRTDALGRRSDQLLGTEYPEPGKSAIVERILNDERWEGELVHFTGQGSRIVVASRWALLRDENSVPTGILEINSDITRRKLAEERLRENEALLAESQRLAHIGSWEWHLESGTIRWSDELYRIMGQTPDSMTPSFDGFLNLVHPGMRTKVRETLEIAVETGACFSFDYRVAMPDGSEKTLAALGDAITDEEGTLVALRGTVQDITERTHAQERLAAQAGLLDLAHDAIRVIDWTTDRIVYWNQGAADLYDYTREEAIGAVSQDLLRTEFPEPGREALKARLLIDKQWDGEIVHHKRDGTRIVVASRWALQLDERGAPRGILQINSDITQRKQEEEELRQNALILASQMREAQRARSESRAVLDAASEAMILLSPDEGRVLSVNQRFSEFFGLASEQLVGRPIAEMRPWIERSFDDPHDVATLIVDHTADSRRQIIEIVIQHAPERRELQLFSNPVLGHDGTFLGRLHAFRDITLERASDRMKSEFISLVSHELRTPLTSIKGYVDVLLDGDLGPIPADQEKFLRIASQNTDRLVVLINELLDISRIESGHVEVDRDPLNLESIVVDVVDSMRPQLEGSGHGLTLDLAIQEPAIIGDGNRVTQIVTNLLSNAIKYTPAGGAITIKARPEAASVRVDITDTGIGLSSEEQSQLFSKFFRAQNSMTQRVGGTGLGLVITRALVEMQGGQMSVSSVKGEGSTFSFVLPAPSSEAPIELVRPGRGVKRILVVEDEPEIANLIRFYLEQAGFDVVVAATAAAALRTARSSPFDLITLDILLPDTDGYAVLRELKNDPRMAATPILLVSILPNDGQGTSLGAAAVITKPLEKQALLEQVHQLIDGRDV